MTTAVPTSAEELEASLGDMEKVQAMIADGTFQNHIKNYVRAANDADKTLLEQVKEQTHDILTNFLRDNPDAGSAKRLNLDPYNGPGKYNYNPVKNPNAIGAKLDGMFPDLATYMQAVWYNGNPKPEVAEKLQEIRNYQESVGAEGGYLVPEEFRSELAMMSLGPAIVRPRARVIPMSSATLRFPKIDETSRVSSVFGGVVVYRTEEGDEINESEASFGSIKLEATKQTALAHVTNELVRDWGGFSVFIEQIFPEALAFYEDRDFVRGNGAGGPLGALAAANGAIIEVAKMPNQVAATVVWENVIRMYARMIPSSIPRAVWIVSPDVFVELATMALVVGTGGAAVWLTDGTAAPMLTLLGRPVIMTEQAPAAKGTRGDISFVDFGMYLIGDRQRLIVDSSPHVKFTSDKTTYRMIARNDGRPWIESALTPANNSDSLSAFVQLATRA